MERILVIEDDNRVRKALRRLFEPEGFEIQEREDGIAGIDAAKSLACNGAL